MAPITTPWSPVMCVANDIQNVATSTRRRCVMSSPRSFSCGPSAQLMVCSGSVLDVPANERPITRAAARLDDESTTSIGSREAMAFAALRWEERQRRQHKQQHCPMMHEQQASPGVESASQPKQEATSERRVHMSGCSGGCASPSCQ